MLVVKAHLRAVNPMDETINNINVVTEVTPSPAIKVHAG